MASHVLSRPAEQLVLERIPSLLHLEALLALRRELRQWLDAPVLAAVLRVPAAVAERVLEDPGGANLVDVRIGSSLAFRFAPLDARVLPLIDEIAAVRNADSRVIEAAFARRGTGLSSVDRNSRV